MNSISIVSNTVTMTSLELVDYINSQREADEPELTHANFLAKVPKVLGETSHSFECDLPDAYRRARRGYRFPKRDAARLKDQLGFSARHATILQVEDAAGEDYDFVPLRRWCKAHEVTPETVPDKRYPKGVKAWPAAAWMDVYGVDLGTLFAKDTGACA